MSEQRYAVARLASEGNCGRQWVVIEESTKAEAAATYTERHATELAAALNAAERRDAERKLLEKMAVLIRVVLENSYWHSDKYAAGRELLAEYAALQTEE